MTPQQRYHRAIHNGELIPDPVQAEFVVVLNELHQTLGETRKSTARGWFSGLHQRFRPQREAPVQGIYVWGGVGRGKTLLVDTFFETLPFENKLRMHFHNFMQVVHEKLKILQHRQDPLQEVAADLATRARVLCFDEFHVADIADAMILGRLLDALFARGVVLVATSNTAPDALYARGLQRARFMAAIQLIHQHTRVIHLESAQDYRLRTLERESVYHHPLNEDSAQRMAHCFKELAADSGLEDKVVVIAGRRISIRGLAHGCAWFDFSDLCDTARAASDYLELSRRYHTLMVSNVPHMGSESNDPALRFIHLVDSLYDRNVNLVLSAAGEPASLYKGKRHAGAFRRTRSRLEEMQSRDYLAKAHIG